jgi:hypothetical protein
MKYALFAGDNYYPCGGMSDFISKFATIEEAKREALRAHPHRDNSGTWFFDWWQIVEIETFEIVESSAA